MRRKVFDPERAKRIKESRNKRLNKHINFDREGEKSSARKDATSVVCCTCKKRFVLPFKPRRPEVYCDDCFKKRR